MADFEALLARRDSTEWVGKAIQGMEKMIFDLLDSAYNGNTYEKALACLDALRSGCVIQEVINISPVYWLCSIINITFSSLHLLYLFIHPNTCDQWMDVHMWG